MKTYFWFNLSDLHNFSFSFLRVIYAHIVGYPCFWEHGLEPGVQLSL